MPDVSVVRALVLVLSWKSGTTCPKGKKPGFFVTSWKVTGHHFHIRGDSLTFQEPKSFLP